MQVPEQVLVLRHAKSSSATLLFYYRRCPPDPTESKLGTYYEIMTQLISTAPSDYSIGDKNNVNWVIEDRKLPHFLFGSLSPNLYHCNGVICLIEDSKTITLCNLGLREFSVFNPETNLAIDEFRILGTGSGCDTTDGNYKIVRLLEHMKAEVFTPGSSTNSWREIDVSAEIEPKQVLDHHVFSNGKCFWLICGGQLEVLCFDFLSEVFGTIPLPAELDIFDFDEMHICLALRNDSVCLFWHPEEELESGYSILVWELDIDNDGGTGDDDYSWTTCVDIKLLRESIFRWTFWKNDELLMTDGGERTLSYNIRTQKLKKSPISLSSSCYLGPYVKSLVSIKEKKQV